MAVILSGRNSLMSHRGSFAKESRRTVSPSALRTPSPSAASAASTIIQWGLTSGIGKGGHSLLLPPIPCLMLRLLLDSLIGGPLRYSRKAVAEQTDTLWTPT